MIDLAEVPQTQKDMAKMQLQMRLEQLDADDKAYKKQIQTILEAEIDMKEKIMEEQLYLQRDQFKAVLDVEKQAEFNKQKAELEAVKMQIKQGNISSKDPFIQRTAIINSIEEMLNT